MPHLSRPDRFPIYIWDLGDGVQFYGFPADDDGRVKVAFFRTKEWRRADSLRAALAPCIPSLATGVLVDTADCRYTLTPDHHFVIGRHPHHQQVVIASPCSGHGYKFASVIGEILADLAIDGAHAITRSICSLRRASPVQLDSPKSDSNNEGRQLPSEVPHEACGASPSQFFSALRGPPPPNTINMRALGDKLGTVHFETSCAAATRADFDRAVALLHSFEYRPAMESFNKVLAADSSCAIAYWGIALCQWGNPFAGVKAGPLLERGLDGSAEGTGHRCADAARKGISHCGQRALRERCHRAASRSNAGLRQGDGRRSAGATRRMSKRRIFYALAVNQTAVPTDKTYAAQLQAAGILEPLWTRYPDHPGLPHYIIHAYDHPPLAAKALTPRAATRRSPRRRRMRSTCRRTPSRAWGRGKESVETNIAVRGGSAEARR